MRLLMLVLLILGCSGKDKNIEDYKDDLGKINGVSRTWIERVGLSATVEPDWDKSVDDAGTFDGFLCFTGERKSQIAIDASQGSNGRMWRAPVQVNTEATYSRDAAVGQLACFLKTRNTGRLQAWVNYIESNGGRLCPELRNCEINSLSPLWSAFALTFEYLGLPLTPRLEKYKHNHLTMAAQVHATSGYATHILGMEVMIIQAAGKKKVTTSELLTKKQPENPFYRWLNGEDRKAAELVSQYCPRTRPSLRVDWIWQRDAPFDPNRSSGWDCVALTNLLLKGASSESFLE